MIDHGLNGPVALYLFGAGSEVTIAAVGDEAVQGILSDTFNFCDKSQDGIR